MRIIDHINERKRDGKVPYFSFEYFPPKTDEAIVHLKSRVERMVTDLDPLFVDVTWGAGGTTSSSSLDISSWIQAFSGAECMMHLTLTNMTLEEIDVALETAKEKGITNILALRGDPPRGQEQWVPQEGGLTYATDLVRYIKEKYGDFFGLTVAGYPEGHIDCASKDIDLRRLKEKVDAGSDFVISQLFYDVDLFLEFVQKCRDIGITCPIIPGIMPIQSYGGFQRMTTFCKTQVPQHIVDSLESLKHDDDLVKNYGVQLAIDMCKKLLAHGVEGFHFYTLNLERTVRRIVEGLEIVNTERLTPWRKVATRPEEGVRPIHWSYRPKSYISRTLAWDDYPNGRWGDSRSPAYGFEYPMAGSHPPVNNEALLKMWGTPTTEQHVQEVFRNFLNKEIALIPWFEEKCLEEIYLIKDVLLMLISNNMFTLTSQPAFNAVPSNDPKYGWGPTFAKTHGYLYQKCYIEFFCPPGLLDAFVNHLEQYPSISYFAADYQGEYKSNLNNSDVIAVTWGVFPNREIIQPTVVDREVLYNWWRVEAFNVWVNEWGALYEEDSPSTELLKRIRDTYWLVNVIDNDYVQGNVRELYMSFFAQNRQPANGVTQ